MIWNDMVIWKVEIWSTFLPLIAHPNIIVPEFWVLWWIEFHWLVDCVALSLKNLFCSNYRVKHKRRVTESCQSMQLIILSLNASENQWDTTQVWNNPRTPAFEHHNDFVSSSSRVCLRLVFNQRYTHAFSCGQYYNSFHSNWYLVEILFSHVSYIVLFFK